MIFYKKGFNKNSHIYVNHVAFYLKLHNLGTHKKRSVGRALCGQSRVGEEAERGGSLVDTDGVVEGQDAARFL